MDFCWLLIVVSLGLIQDESVALANTHPFDFSQILLEQSTDTYQITTLSGDVTLTLSGASSAPQKDSHGIEFDGTMVFEESSISPYSTNPFSYEFWIKIASGATYPMTLLHRAQIVGGSVSRNFAEIQILSTSAVRVSHVSNYVDFTLQTSLTGKLQHWPNHLRGGLVSYNDIL